MIFIPSFKMNEVVGNADIMDEFRCGIMGGMRRSKQTNTLVIITDHTKNLYEDKWYGDILHYTGMGKHGDQDIDFMQNKTLAESRSNGVGIYLFEVIKPKQYIYRGPIELYKTPYQEIQEGEDGLPRKVWIFPMRIKTYGSIN